MHSIGLLVKFWRLNDRVLGSWQRKLLNISPIGSGRLHQRRLELGLVRLVLIDQRLDLLEQNECQSQLRLALQFKLDVLRALYNFQVQVDIDLLLALIVHEFGLIRDQIVDEARDQLCQLHVTLLLALDLGDQPLILGLDVRQLLRGRVLLLLILSDAPLQEARKV